MAERNPEINIEEKPFDYIWSLTNGAEEASWASGALAITLKRETIEGDKFIELHIGSKDGSIKEYYCIEGDEVIEGMYVSASVVGFGQSGDYSLELSQEDRYKREKELVVKIARYLKLQIGTLANTHE